MIEGVLSSSAIYVAVIDGDLQHDETRLPVMLAALRSGQYDLAVASRHVEGGDNAGLANKWRHVLSDGGNWLAHKILPVTLTDPMSGFFMLPARHVRKAGDPIDRAGVQDPAGSGVERADAAAGEGGPGEFHQRVAGESKLDAQVMIQFGGAAVGQDVRRVICRCGSCRSPRWAPWA